MAKKNQMEITPIMALSMFAVFAMMIPMYSILTQNYRVTTTNAQEARVAPTETPSPTPQPLY